MALPTTPASLLPIVLQAMSRTPDARLRQLLGSLTTHLHQFVIDNQVSEAEFERAVGFIVGIGQATGPKKNEVILASDLLGVSTLVTLLNYSAGGARYEITVSNPDHCCRGVALAHLDGVRVDASEVPLIDDGAVHRLDVVLGRASGE